MRFGKRIKEEQDDHFEGSYVDYQGLKKHIKAEEERDARHGPGAHAADARETSISVAASRANRGDNAPTFFDLFDKEVRKLGKEIQKEADGIRSQIDSLSKDVDALDKKNDRKKQQLTEKASSIGDTFLRLEKFVNLNYLGLHKILKKHDKKLPHKSCRQFYIAQLHKQPWLDGDYSDILVRLSALFSAMRGDSAGIKNEDASQGFVRSTSKFWVRERGVSSVKYTILQHLPVFQFNPDPDERFPHDAQLINSVYLDNSLLELYHGRLDKRPDAIAMRIRWYGTGDPKVVFVERKTHREGWKGEMSVKERFMLKESQVIPFLENRYSVEEATKEMREKGKPDGEIEAFAQLFTECQKQVDSKQLRPMIRTQYMRTAFQIPFDATVRISLDTNLTMIKESVDEGDGVPLERWFRDPNKELMRTDITRFPHAVLEVKLSLPEGSEAPRWVSELTEDPDRCTEVHKFSKFIHGTCTLFPTLVQSVPYWVDDESVRSSMVASAPLSPPILNNAEIENRKPRETFGLGGRAPVTHPLLGDQPTLQLIQEGRRSGNHGQDGPPPPTWFDRIIGADVPRMRTMPMKIEPKTFFANERTFLHWLHMAVTVGSIAAALLGFASTADRSGKAAHEATSVEVICMILLPVAILLCAYALLLFLWRSKMIAFALDGAIDDRRGPLVLATVVCLALFSIFCLSIKDLVDTMHERDESAALLFSSLMPGSQQRWLRTVPPP